MKEKKEKMITAVISTISNKDLMIKQWRYMRTLLIRDMEESTYLLKLRALDLIRREDIEFSYPIMQCFACEPVAARCDICPIKGHWPDEHGNFNLMRCYKSDNENRPAYFVFEDPKNKEELRLKMIELIIEAAEKYWDEES